MKLWEGFEIGTDRNYEYTTNVPGLPFSGKEASEGSVWYRKKVQLPAGEWNRATLLLRGAKYAPKVYINGEKVSECEGGLSITRHLLSHDLVKPEAEIELEICLSSLKDIPDSDASKVTPGDMWRTCLASHIWDDVELLTHRDIRVDSITTAYEAEKNQLEIFYQAKLFSKGQKLRFSLYDNGKVLGTCESEAIEKGKMLISFSETPVLWSPETPALYTLVCEGEGWKSEQSVGLRRFEIRDKHFFLNGNPITIRMGSIVWHRWLRDDDTHEVAFSEEWFEKHVLLALKRRGANAIRFHLGTPPKRYLDLCDKHGMLVQTEWSFFHKMPASDESIISQWKDWFGDALAHPSVCIMHPWNELNEEDVFRKALTYIDTVAADYPPCIISHRDVRHVHAYWWSIFENLGLYYDGPEDFDKAVIVDEFGGNYLGYDGEEGAYPTIRGAMQRFLGNDRTKEERVWLHTVANGKVAEYWRRTGVAGFSPFVILSSADDGNTHFFGNVENPVEMPVWDALRPAYAPVSVSLNVWDRNFEPKQQYEAEVYLFNDTGKEETLEVRCGIGTYAYEFTQTLPPYSRYIKKVKFLLPETQGEYKMYAACGEVRSEWDVFVREIQVPDIQGTMAVLPEEKELIAFFEENGISYTIDIREGDALVGLHKTYEVLKEDGEIRREAEALLKAGKPWHIFGAGPEAEGRKHNGIGKNTVRFSLGKELERFPISDTVSVVFYKCIEGESHVHPVCPESPLWNGIDKKQMWLLNGRRGGLILPAAEMEIEGADAEGFLQKWMNAGADEEAIRTRPYFVLSSIGMHVFSEKTTEKEREALQEKVDFLLADAPALKNNMDDYTVKVTNLHDVYKKRLESPVKSEHLLKAGIRLGKIPAICIKQGNGLGDIYLWQLFMDGRLGGKDKEIYGLRRDEAACQLLLNSIAYTDKEAGRIDGEISD